MNELRQAFDEVLNSVAATYVSFPFNKIEKYGLTQGLGGLVITYCLLSTYTGDPKLKVLSDEAINKLFAVASEIGSLDFETGLTGVCWTIEWLKQNGYIKYNTDEIFEEVDGAVYKNLFSKVGRETADTSETINLVKYLLSRYRSKNIGSSRYIKLVHQECLLLSLDFSVQKILVSDEYKSILSGKNIKGFLTHLANLQDVILLISAILEERLNIPRAEEKLYLLMDHADALLTNTTSLIDKIGDKAAWRFFVKLAVACYRVGEVQQFNCWKKKAEVHLQDLYDSAENQLSLSLEDLSVLLFLLPFISREKEERVKSFCHEIVSFKGLPMRLKDGNGQLLISILSNVILDQEREWTALFFL